MLWKFRRMRAMDPLQVAMTGVRMGERYLQIFCNDSALTGGLATKTGLSGTAALAAGDEQEAARARATATKSGALIDVKVTNWTSLPWSRDAFDMIVIDNTGASFGALGASARGALLQSAREVLRQGGRVELIEREREAPGASEAALREAGFKPVRVLAEKDGFRFIEGLNT